MLIRDGFYLGFSNLAGESTALLVGAEFLRGPKCP
jgi:hypothetical protein